MQLQLGRGGGMTTTHTADGESGLCTGNRLTSPAPPPLGITFLTLGVPGLAFCPTLELD